MTEVKKEIYVKLVVVNFIVAVKRLGLDRANREDFTEEQETDYLNARGILGIVLAADKVFSDTCLIPIRCVPWLNRLEALTETDVFEHL